MLLIILATLLLVPAAWGQNVITTVAGQDFVFRGDGGAALNAPLGAIAGSAVDSAGNIFLADPTQNLVMKISPNGLLTVVAGNGISGFSGDGGPARSASLRYPVGVALGPDGSLYIADSVNYRIRKVTSAGIITTVAGSGRRGFSGDGGPAINASFMSPAGVAVDAAGTLYVTDRDSHRIRKVTSDGIITTVAGNGVAGFSGDGGPASNASLKLTFPGDGVRPCGIALDASGNLYIADKENARVRKVAANGTISTIAGTGVAGAAGDGGPAASATLNGPAGLAVGADGSLYIAEISNMRVRRVTAGGTITTVAGSGTLGFSGDGGLAVNATMNFPEGVSVDSSGALYVSDTQNLRLRKFRPGGTISTIAGNALFRFSGDGGPATSASLNFPLGVAVDAAGNLFIADDKNNRVRRMDRGGAITTVAGNGTPAFSGDGGPGANASLFEPCGVALDRSGDLYIFDGRNRRVRKLSTGGIITTVAGNGQGGSSGDGGPAVAAALSAGGGAVDGSGNLYIADRVGNRIRKVNPAGTITTVAGNGTEGFSGDGGPAVNASLALYSVQFPFFSCSGLAVDGAGTLFVADQFNNRIRRITTNGIINTIAGNGAAGFSGDGAPALSASLNQPRGIVADASGGFYFSDSGNNRVRRVGPEGIITTIAGTGSGGFSGDGGAATAARVSTPHGLATDSAGNVYFADRGNDRIRKILAVPPSLLTTPAALSFTAQSGDPAAAAQRISISSSAGGLSWNAVASSESWLSVSPTAGSAPGTVTVSVNLSNLAPGTYRGSVRIESPLASPPAINVPVDLTVTGASSVALRVEPSSLSFDVRAGGGVQAAQLRVSNAGAGLLSWAARAETSGGGNWLAISPESGSASLSSPAFVQVTANAQGLPDGVYSGSVRVESSTTSQEQTIGVTLLVSQVTQTILLSQSGLLFTGVEGGASAPSQTFGVLNTGRGVMNWTVQASTLSGGNWLSALSSTGGTSGSSDAASLQVPLVEVGVNLAGLRAGQYSGLIRLTAPAANNSPQLVTVELTVLPPGSNPGVLVRPTGLIFAAREGTSSPGSQTVRLATAVPGNVEARSGLLTFDGGDWLEAAPRNAVLSPSEPQTLTIQPALGSLQPGVYSGALTLLFSDGSPSQVVNVLFLVVAPSGAAAAPGPRSSTGALLVARTGAASDCVPQRLHAIHRSLGGNFASPVGWPTTIEVQVVNDCGVAVPDASVAAAFSNGDPPLPLVSLGNGLYVGSWRPLNASARVSVTARASLAPLAATEVQAQGVVQGNQTAPALFSGGIVNGASFARGAALAPGSIVSVFGRNLARGLNHAARLPLETTLGGATLSVGGFDAPLFFSSDGQINAQLPFELPAGTRQQVVVRTLRESTAQEALTVPETFTVAPAQPGIFTINQQGSGQGAILNAQGQLADGTAPARVGGVVQVFCTGLGATQPRVMSGRPAPAAEPLARVVTPVEARIGGRPAVVHFAGLAPGFVGLYQVNVQVPAGVEPGPAVPLVLLLGGAPSNTVTIAVRP